MRRKLLIAALVISGTPPVQAAPGDAVEDQAPAPTSKMSDAMLAVVQEQRRQLESERAELEQLRIDLKAAEAALDTKLTAVEKAIAEQKSLLQRTEALSKEIKDRKLARLIKLTEKMPPVEAAAYLTKLDEPTASSILQGMRVRQASMVMAALHPKKAASLSRTYLQHDKPVGSPPSRD